MSLPIPGPEAVWETKVKEVDQVVFTRDPDKGLIPNLAKITFVGEWLVQNSIDLMNNYGSIVVAIQSTVDDCGVWIDKDSTADNPCGNNTVTFVWITPRQPDASKTQIKEFMDKLRAASRTV